VEELLVRSRKLDPHIGFATVYRTLKLLVAAGLAHERDFNTGRKLYENAEAGENHDHLVCIECGAVHEFQDPGIHTIQAEIADQHGYSIVSYRHEIYGFCAHCSKKKN
jgi:Fur family ferric uptake transcriptional regulator